MMALKNCLPINTTTKINKGKLLPFQPTSIVFFRYQNKLLYVLNNLNWKRLAKFLHVHELGSLELVKFDTELKKRLCLQITEFFFLRKIKILITKMQIFI